MKLSLLDKFCIFLLGALWFFGVALGLAVVFAIVIMIGNA